MITEYTIIRSKRKTLALYIKDGRLEVRAPHKLSKSQIERFVSSKEGWITSKLTQSTERIEKKEAFELNYGDKILYLGKECPIVAKDGKYYGFDSEIFYMPNGMNPNEIKNTCIKIYRDLAKSNIRRWTEKFSETMGVAPASIKITSAKTRWGSCSSKGNINFSWRLIMADRKAVEYVIVHELCHIKMMNHSKDFWKLVEGVLPDYREREAILKKLQKRLATENW